MKIVVIGGTGLIGSKTVAIRHGGHEAIALAQKGRQQHHGRGARGGHGRRGLGHHPAVVYAIRLAQPEGAWKNFDRSSGWRHLVFPAWQRDARRHDTHTPSNAVALPVADSLD